MVSAYADGLVDFFIKVLYLCPGNKYLQPVLRTFQFFPLFNRRVKKKNRIFSALYYIINHTSQYFSFESDDQVFTMQCFSRNIKLSTAYTPFCVEAARQTVIDG